MNKRTGVVAGAALLAAGIGIPGFAGAAADEARPSYYETDRIEGVVRAGVPDFGIGRVEPSALGLDATGGMVNDSRLHDNAAAYAIDTVEAADLGVDPHLTYGLKNVEVNALGVDPYGGFVEPGPSVWDADRTPSRDAAAAADRRNAGLPDFGIDRPEVSAFEADPNADASARSKSTPISQGEITNQYALGLDPFGGDVEIWPSVWDFDPTPSRNTAAVTNARNAGLPDFGIDRPEVSAFEGDPYADASVRGKSAPVPQGEITNPYAMGLDPFGGVVETWTPTLADAAVEVTNQYAMGLDPWGGVTEQA